MFMILKSITGFCTRQEVLTTQVGIQKRIELHK